MASPKPSVGLPAWNGTPASDEEKRAILKDLSWLDVCHCWQVELGEFFVSPGHVISEQADYVSRTCPARRAELIFAYGRGIFQGYVGGLSPARRRNMPLDEALAHAAEDYRHAIRQPAGATT